MYRYIDLVRSMMSGFYHRPHGISASSGRGSLIQVRHLCDGQRYLIGVTEAGIGSFNATQMAPRCRPPIASSGTVCVATRRTATVDTPGHFQRGRYSMGFTSGLCVAKNCTTLKRMDKTWPWNHAFTSAFFQLNAISKIK